MRKNTPHMNAEEDRPWKLSLSTKTLIQGKITRERKKRQNASEHPRVAYILPSIQAISKCDGKVQTLTRAREKNISHPRFVTWTYNTVQR